MNLAAAAPEQNESTVSQTVPVVVLGTDALLAATPYTAVQLAHACLQAGYASVVPASWGDELVAAAVLRRLPSFGHGPAIQCSCPIVAHRLLTTGGDLRPVMLPLVSPPVALARYVRAVSHPTRVRITYVGGCPGAVDDSIDIRMSPDTLIGMLAERQIVLDEQPRVFESIIPPDRRRYFSQPGGVPSAERLWTDLGARALVDVESDDFVSEIADHLLAGEHVLMDVAPRLGCLCSGAIAGTPPREARAGVVALEPPRSSALVIEEQAPLNLDLPIPAVPRTPVDVVLAARTPSSSLGLPTPPAPASAHRTTPTVTEPRVPRVPPQPPARPITGAVPTARHADGKSLPRAYVARRRQSAPKGSPSVPAPSSNATAPTEPTVEKNSIEEASTEAISASEAAPSEAPASEKLSGDRVGGHALAIDVVAGETQLAENVERSDAEKTVVEAALTEEPLNESVISAPIAEVAAVEARSETPNGERPTPSTRHETVRAETAREEPSSPAAISEGSAPPSQVSVQATMTSASEPPSAPEGFVDLNQLHFDGLAPAERLPIFTPTPAPMPAFTTPAAPPSPSLKPVQAATQVPRKRSRVAMYVIVVALAIVVVAGVAYVVGRSAQEPDAPTGQLP